MREMDLRDGIVEPEKPKKPRQPRMSDFADGEGEPLRWGVVPEDTSNEAKENVPSDDDREV